MSLPDAAKESRLAALIALRDVLAHNISICESGRDLAALSGRFQSVMQEIADLAPVEQEGDEVDEIAQRRAARRAGAAKGAARSKRSG